ncbi:VCBS repeat-containing protein [bacterium]|nr:VCBS repeat-containing protein [candidate division CSSED10-310 bacterium]
MRKLIIFMLLSGFAWGIVPSAEADTQWTDMVSPINHSEWPDIAIADFNTDGIPDIVAANPDASEMFSNYSGLPVWIGRIYNGPAGGYYWGLAGGSNVDGTVASLPIPDPNNIGQAHVACVFTGNTCNMMAEWTFELGGGAGILDVITIQGESTFSAEIPPGVYWPVRFHAMNDRWQFTQIEGSDTFSVSSILHNTQENQMVLGQVYVSDNAEITVLCQRETALHPDEIFEIVTGTVLGGVRGMYRDTYPDYRYLENRDFETEIPPAEWFVDRTNLMGFRYDLPQNFGEIFPGDKYYFHTPLGPFTNNGYIAVEAADINQDGQVDIIGAGPDGIDIFYQAGPSISSVGFIDEPILLDFPPRLDVQLGTPLGYINPSVVYDEVWSVTWQNDRFLVTGEILGSSGPEYYGGESTSYCQEISLMGYSGTDFSNGDRFTFSTKRVNFAARTGPVTANSYSNMAVGDVDRNGWMDVLAGKESGGFDVFTFDGINWTFSSTIPFSGIISDIVLKDVNRDGWLDVVASSNTGIHFWEGLPAGGWSSDKGPAFGRAFLGVTTGDFNKDGYIDIAATEDLAAQTGSIEVFYLTAEETWFQNARATVPVANPNNIGDGFMGMVRVSNTTTVAESWRVVCETAQPDGGLFKVTGSRSGQQAQYARVGELFSSDNSEVEFTLFDGDVDYQVGDFFTFQTGRGPLELRQFGKLDSSDLDNDGNLDLFAVSLENYGVGVWFGNSNYGWTADTPPESSSSWQEINTGHDLNFDGNPDIVVGSYANVGESGSGIKIWTGKHTNENTWTGWIYQLIGTGRFNKIDNGDFNIDGALDVVLACDDESAEGIWVFTGNNLGDFTKVTTSVTTKKGYFSVITGDFNMDGRSDIVAGHKTSGFDVFLTRDDLTWSLSTSSVTLGEVYDLAAADVDHDGDLDLAIAQSYISPDRPGVVVYFNDGNGYFNETNKRILPSALYNHWSVELIDLDVNGALDVVTTNTGGNPGVQVYYGFFDDEEWLLSSPVNFVDPSGLDHNYGLIGMDFNLDNRPDFIVGEDGHACTTYIGFSGLSLECNFGFTGLGFGKIRDLDTDDLNNDGYPDVVIATEQNGVLAYKTIPGYPGLPSFGFAPITHPANNGDYVGITVADFTSDGLPDVIAARNQDSGVSGIDMWISYRDFTMAKVNSTYPSDGGEFNVGADSSIYVNFSEPMDPATMTYDNIQLTREGEPVGYSFIMVNNNDRLQITPAKMIRDQEYAVRIVGGPNGVRDSNGNMFDGNFNNQADPSPVDDFEFTFTTVDRVKPSIPIGLIVTPGDASATVQWTANSHPILDEDLDGYYVIWELADESEDIKYSFYSKEELGSPPRITIRGLSNELEILCSVVAKDFTGNESSFSEKVPVIPQPVRPQIWWAGMYDSLIQSSAGGEMSIVAYVFDYQGDTESVELYFNDLPTGVFLQDGGHPDFPPGLGLYALYAPLGPLNTGFVQFPFQLVAHDISGNHSLMWPYFHVQKNIPGGEQSSSKAMPEIGSWESYFAHRNQEFIARTTIPFDRAQPSISPNRPQILCAGYSAHPEADYEWGARHWLTAIILDPNNPSGGHDMAYVDLFINGTPAYRLGASGIANEGFIDELNLTPVLWGIDLSWYGSENDPDGPEGENHWPAGPQFLEIQAVDRQGNASDIWPNFTIN